jgi:Zn-dependent protease with chaperone function
MNFFERQEQARKKSFYLLFLFVIALFITSFSLGYGFQIVVQTFFEGNNIILYFRETKSLPKEFISLSNKTSAIFGFLLLIVTLYRTLKISKGKNLMILLGGTEIQPSTKDNNEKRLLNIVEEMSIASGVTIPAVFVLKNEGSINALAAGESSQDHAIAVTQGALENLPRDEMQAVIAHEFSHLLHGDMKLNTDLAGAISGIVIFREFGKHLFEISRRGRSRKGSGQLVLVGIFFWIMGSLGVLVAKFIQMAISRQREHLADASAAQFTRNPQALAKALARIKAIMGSKIHSSQSLHYSHFFFANPERSEFLSSHPSLDERIKLLDPHFNIEEFVAQAIKKEANENELDNKINSSPTPVTSVQKIQDLVGLVGLPMAHSLNLAESTLANIPSKFKDGLVDRKIAQAVVYGCILSIQTTEVAKQMTELIDDKNYKNWTHQAIEFCQNNRSSSTALMTLAIFTAATAPLEERKQFFSLLKRVLSVDHKITSMEALHLALIYFNLDLQKESMSPINTLPPIQDSWNRIFSISKNRTIGLNWETFLEDVRKLRRLSGKLNQKFFLDLMASLNQQDIPESEKEEYKRLVCMLFEFPIART